MTYKREAPSSAHCLQTISDLRNLNLREQLLFLNKLTINVPEMRTAISPSANESALTRKCRKNTAVRPVSYAAPAEVQLWMATGFHVFK
jgi:hypothetical protein